MKQTLLFLTLLLCSVFSFSQNGTSTFLTWMKGDNLVEQPGTYGTRGTANATNKPGARDFSATWRDSQGNLWLFGGYGIDATGNIGYHNDLWKYDPLANTWTWIKGDNAVGQHAVYGTQGVANDANKPGASYASVSWTDASGQLWLFGGFGFTGTEFGYRNDLWKYNPATNQWTWIKGNNAIDQSGTYGTKGTAHANNKPGGRYGSRTWTDNSGNLWLFGGYGFDRDSPGTLNDLWKYNPATNKWTWVNGDNIINQFSRYGTKGVADPQNEPGSRYVSISWTDSNNNFWLFGGYGNSTNKEGYLSDLWKYNPPNNQWTWISGDSTVDQKGIYGTQSVAHTANKPGSRYVSVSWIDSNNDLWLFGGYGFDSHAEGYLNDLWKYDPDINQWTWMKGDNDINQPGVYGTQGMPVFTNKSGARTSSVSWTDGMGHLWLFGGYGYDASNSGLLNDLWKISSFQVLPVQLLQFNGVLRNDIVTLQWKSSQEINFSYYIVERSYDGVHFTAISQVSGKGNAINEYSHTDNDISATKTEKVYYRLQLMNADGRSTYSKTVAFDRTSATLVMHVYPNPVSHSLYLGFDTEVTGLVTINIIDVKGVVVKSQAENMVAGRQSRQMDISTLPSGAYIATVRSVTMKAQQKFIKQ
jgi:N-acetylneuraminic acid mutarotase